MYTLAPLKASSGVNVAMTTADRSGDEQDVVVAGESKGTRTTYADREVDGQADGSKVGATEWQPRSRRQMSEIHPWAHQGRP